MRFDHGSITEHLQMQRQQQVGTEHLQMQRQQQVGLLPEYFV